MKPQIAINSTLINIEDLAAIQYLGVSGATGESFAGIKRLIHYGDVINEAKLLTCHNENSRKHAFLLNVNCGDIFGIKSGFASGYKYRGTGAAGLAKSLMLLIRHKVKIKEYNVDEGLLDRLDNSCLLSTDIIDLEHTKPVKPEKYHNYIYDMYPSVLNAPDDVEDERLRGTFPVTIPYAILDARLLDISIDFFENPDNNLMTAFRRLEGIVKQRTNIKGKSGNKLFSEAFLGKESILHWNDEDDGEQAAKANMFSSIYGAYRNPRAHRETQLSDQEALRELLLINQLYVLENLSVLRN
jgi:hypothetical protein